MSEYDKQSREELKALVESKREALRNFRFAMAGSKSKNVREGKATKKEIARILTSLNSPKRK